MKTASVVAVFFPSSALDNAKAQSAQLIYSEAPTTDLPTVFSGWLKIASAIKPTLTVSSPMNGIIASGEQGRVKTYLFVPG